jgi:NAD(P)-dependent dehydrogenase (short-subunit alcohol dehydrogenase family)
MFQVACLPIYDIAQTSKRSESMSPLVLNGLKLFAAVAAARALLRRARKIDFAGRTVVISGGSRGLGLEIARRFAREGAAVALLARDDAELEEAQRELEAMRAPVLSLRCDIRHEQDVDKSVRRIIDWRGRIDVLVNNAGVIQVGPFENMEREDFDAALDIHLWGPFRLMQQVIPQMKGQGGGRIVNIASIGGKVAVPHLLPYSASKFALVGLSDGIRSELAKHGIRVTTVCPGLMRTGSHVNASFKGHHKAEFALFSISNAVPLFSVSSARAARQIVEACRYGDPFLMISPQARMLHLVNAVLPNLTADVFNIIGRIIPPATSSDATKNGWESRSRLAPRWVTKLADDAIERNNENTRRYDKQVVPASETSKSMH